jgi:hypothetical protein
MPASPEELDASLKKFRLDVLDALAGLSTGIDALEWAIQEGASVPADRLKELRRKAKDELHETHRRRFAEQIAIPNEVR